MEIKQMLQSFRAVTGIEDVEETSVFGWLIQTMAELVTDSERKADRQMDNFFLDSSDSDTLYKYAKQVNLDSSIFFCRPSVATLLLGLSVAELKVAMGNSGSNNFIIDRNDSFFINGILFKVRYPVELSLTSFASSSSFAARTIDDGISFYDIPVPDDIRTFFSVVNGREYIFIELAVVQYAVQYASTRVMRQKVSSTSSRFEMVYRDNNQSSLAFINITAPGYTVHAHLNETTETNTSKTLNVVYTIQDDKVCFLLADLPFNLEMTFELYTASFFTNNSPLTIKDYTLSVLLNKYRTVVPSLELVIPPQPGKDATKDLIRQRIKYTMFTLNSIVTATDLMKRINDLGYPISFKKTRDDIISRTLSGYVELKDGHTIYKTNTAVCSLDIIKMELGNFVLKEGTTLLYDEVLDVFRLLDDEAYENPASLIAAGKLVYSLPFHVIFKIYPYLRAVAFKPVTNAQIPLRLANVVSNEVSILAKYLTLRYDAYKELFNFELILNTNLPVAEISTAMIIQCRFYSSGNQELEYGYLFMKQVPNFSVYALALKQLRLTPDGVIVDRLLDSSGYELPGMLLPFQFNMELSVIYNDVVYKRFTADVVLATSLERVFSNDFTMSTSAIKIQLPLISTVDYVNNYKSIQANLKHLYSELASMVQYLDTTLNMNVLFVNNYGISKKYDIDRTNLTIDLHVALKDGNYDQQLIKNSVMEFFSNLKDQDIKVSNLLHFLERSHPVIDYIDYRGINGRRQFVIKCNDPYNQEERLSVEEVKITII